MKYFVATISPKFQENYDRCKLLGLWGMTSKKADSKLVKKESIFKLPLPVK